MRPGFSLLDLDRNLLREPEFRSVLGKLLAAWLPLAVAVSALGLILTGSHETFVANILGGLLVGFTVTVLLSVLVSVASGLTGGLLLSAATTIALGAGPFEIRPVSSGANASGPLIATMLRAANDPEAIVVGSIVALAMGVVGRLTFRHQPAGQKESLKVLTASVGALTLVTAGLVLTFQVSSLTVGTMGGISSTVISAWLALGSTTSALIACRRIGPSVVVGVAFGLLSYMLLSVSHGLMDSSAAVASMLAAIVLYFWIPWTFAYHFATKLSSPVGGVVSSAGAPIVVLLVSVAFSEDSIPWTSNLGWYSGAIALGSLIFLWFPILTFPFTALWNVLILAMDSTKSSRDSLRLNSACWDEGQTLPPVALRRALVNAVHADRDFGIRSIGYFLKGPQRTVALSAYSEIASQTLVGCTNIDQVQAVAEKIPIVRGAGDIGGWLYKFRTLSEETRAALTQSNLLRRRGQVDILNERLTALAEELSRSQARSAKKLQAAALQWRDILRDHAIQLTESARERKEIRNPYVVSVPLNAEQELFVGRTDISNQLADLFLNTQTPPILLYGQRRMGKTSLLLNLPRLLPKSILPLFVDMQGPIALSKDYDRFLYNLARRMIVSAKESRDVTLPPLSMEAISIDPSTRFDEWLDAVENSIADRTILLALDEFEALDVALERGAFDAEQVLGTLRHITQHRPRFKILLAGSHTIDEFSRWSNYLIGTYIVKVTYLSRSETTRLVTEPVSDSTLHYETEAVERVLKLTRCHPGLVQMLCYHIVYVKNQQPLDRRFSATPEDVEIAADRLLNAGRFFFDDIEQNQITPEGARILRLLASKGGGGLTEAAAADDTLAADLEIHSGLLLQRDLVEPTTHGFSFQVELIRRWFAQDQFGAAIVPSAN